MQLETDLKLRALKSQLQYTYLEHINIQVLDGAKRRAELYWKAC